MIWDETDQKGWKFEPFEDNDPNGGGYYTFRVGGPLYAVVTSDKEGWLMYLCSEESDEEVGTQTVYQTLDEAKAAAIGSMLVTIETWRNQVIEWVQRQ